MVAAYAEFQLMKGEVDDALNQLEKAIRLEPSNPLPFINKVITIIIRRIHVCDVCSNDKKEGGLKLKPFSSVLLPFACLIIKALISWQQEDYRSAREILEHVIDMDPLYQPAYAFLANLEFRMAPTFEETSRGFELIDKVGGEGRVMAIGEGNIYLVLSVSLMVCWCPAIQGISICRSPEDLEEMCQIKVLATAKIEAARKLGWSSSRAMEI